MANLLTRMLRRQPEISRFSTSDYLRALIQNQYGLLAPLYPSGVSYAKGKPAERIENSFTGYVYGGYKANPIVFGVMKRRSSVFSEARFMWREIDDGRPGDLFYTDDIALLVKPWPNGTTGELLTRMIQDVDLAGNFYAVNEGDRLRRLRPDWVQIVLSGDPRVDVEVDVVGYWYAPGGPDNGAGEAYLPDQVCHWSPLPDPDAMYRGMSWLTPVVREIQGDQAAVDHKLAFFRNGATLGPIVKVSEKLSVAQFKEFIAASEAAHQGVENAYKTMYLGGGADVTLAAADFRQMDFTAAQGKAETRICVASGVPAVIAGVSEGLAGSSLNAGNYNAAKRSFVDGELRTLWRSACAALSTILVVPDDAELWFDETCIAYLREDQQDAATIAQLQMSTIASAITAGFEPASTVLTVNPAWKDSLKHSGLMSVQLTPPGEGEIPGDGGAGAGAGAGAGGDPSGDGALPPIPEGFEPDGYTARARQADNTGVGGSGQSGVPAKQDQSAHPHVASGPKGGQFTSTGGSGGKSSKKSKHNPKPKPKAKGPSGVPQPPPQPRTMRVGDSGEDVRYAQYAMSLLGFHVPQDGSYDQATADAVKLMQARLGMKKPNGHLSASQLHKLQDAVRLSPCIGRSESARAEEWFEEIVRSFGDGDETDDIEDTDDVEDDEDGEESDETGDADETVRSLLDAFDMIARGWSPEQESMHPRGRGGKFIKLGDRIAAALHDWMRGGGDDDPLHEFSREQLRTTAVGLGIKPRRGASSEEIKLDLLNHARQSFRDVEASKVAQSDRFTLKGPGHRDSDVRVYTNAKKEVLLHEEQHLGRPGVRITRQADLAGLEQWAKDNNEPELAAWARTEQARLDAKRTPDVPAPAKKATKAAEKVTVDLGAGAPTEGRTVAQLRQIAAAEGISLPRTAPKAKLVQAIADHRAAPSAPTHTDGLDALEGTQLRKWADEMLPNGGRGMSDAQMRAALRADGVGSPEVEHAKRLAEDAATPAVPMAEVKDRIRAAYAARPKLPGGWVGFADLRDDLPGLSREDVDKALRELSREKGVRVAPLDNTRALRARDKEAALDHHGDSLKHMIAMDSTPAPVQLSDAQIESKVRDVYAQLIDRPGDMASLADVRDRLPDIPRSDLDRVLVAMAIGGNGVSIHPESNQKMMKQRHRDAAVSIGNQDKHLLTIQDPKVVRAAVGHDVTPGHDELHHWWTKGPGLARWIESPHQFTTLRDQLVEEAHVTPEVADRWAAAWVHEATGAWPGSDVHRVEEGGKPRGHRIGPG